jgi:hypothetical protein
MEKIFENPYLEMYSLANELPHTIFGYWKGYWELTDPVAMAALEFPFAYILDHGIKVMITDYSYLEVVPEDTAAWIDEVWFPTVVKNGLLAEIVIDAAEIYGQLSVQLMYEHVGAQTGLLTPKVANLDDAKKLARQFLAELARK